MEVTPSNLKPSALYSYNQNLILDNKNLCTSYFE